MFILKVVDYPAKVTSKNHFRVYLFVFIRLYKGNYPMINELNNEIIKDAKPREKKYWLAAGQYNLYVLVMPDGAKYWKFRYRFLDKNKEVTVGKPFPKMKIEEAAKKAHALKTLLDSGIDPAASLRQQKVNAKHRAANTFKEAADAWYNFRLKRWRPRTAAQVRSYLDKDLLPALGRYPLDTISAQMLAELVHKIDGRGAPDVAKKTRQWLRQIYAYARGNGWTDVDPVRDLHAITDIMVESENYPHIKYEELPEFLASLRRVEADIFVKSAVYMAMWTGNRPGVTNTLRWDEIDFDNELWTIEKGRDGMKRGYRHVTPLPKQAVALLRELKPLSGEFEHVFIGRNDPGKSISDGAVNGLLKRMGYGGRQTMHGFRHVVSSALNGMGYPPDWIERQLAHGDPDKIRGTYNKNPYLEQRREMLRDWADTLDKLEQEQRCAVAA